MLPVLSVAMGAVMIEKHFILDRSIGGPDAAFSMDAKEFAAMVRDVRQAEAALDPGAGLPESESTERAGRQWSRSLYVSAPISPGEPFTRDNVACVRPGYGLHPRHLPELLTRRATHAYFPGDRLTPEALGKRIYDASAYWMSLYVSQFEVAGELDQAQFTSLHGEYVD